MDYIYIGEIVNTHGLKGEVRLLSDFEYKKEAFIINKKIYVGKNKEELVIKTYRVHKDYDMFTFDGIEDINDVIIYKGEKAYMKREDIKVDGYFKEDVIGLTAYDQETPIGEVTFIMKSKAHDILVITDKDRKHLVPYIPEFVTNIDLARKRIDIHVVEGLLNEN
ncbi:MAG: 16S rRNA processing protein RimM [Bacilli bacterium]|jgi:16S rRNA processing protein RimM|nr:16S rRNA processing protein RimM [Bacilli bacterium]